MAELVYAGRRSPDMERVCVRLGGGRGYDIRIGFGVLNRCGEILRGCHMEGDYFLLSDETVYRRYGCRIERALRTSGYVMAGRSLIPPGEASKSVGNWQRIVDGLVKVEDGMRRRLFLVVLGGGVVGDLGGFVAATYRRGIPYVQIPTTLLSQVDSSVGGKTALNHPCGKNLIGAYYQPAAVLIDLATLRTLPMREVRSGLAEVIKYGLIRDRALFVYVERNMKAILKRERKVLERIVTRSCQIKARVVEEDEKEQKGVRTILNLGHTVGHALEAASGYSHYAHGEAVGLGILCVAHLSQSLGLFPEEGVRRIRALLVRAGLPVGIRSVSIEAIGEAMKRDKKFIHGRNRFVLPTRIGSVEIVEDIEPYMIRKALEEFIEQTEG